MVVMGRAGLQRVGDRQGISRPLSVLWALVPLLTLGWGTWLSFAYAAIRLRDGVLGAWAGVYFVLGLTSLTLVASSKSQGDWEAYLGTVLALILVAAGSAHAFAIRKRLTDSESPAAVRNRLGFSAGTGAGRGEN